MSLTVAARHRCVVASFPERETGFGPATLWLGTKCSTRLSYSRVPSILGVAGAQACSTETVVPFFGGDNSHSVRRTFRFPEARRATARGVPGARPRLFFSTA